jgi:hypothetical protein
MDYARGDTPPFNEKANRNTRGDTEDVGATGITFLLPVSTKITHPNLSEIAQQKLSKTIIRLRENKVAVRNKCDDTFIADAVRRPSVEAGVHVVSFGLPRGGLLHVRVCFLFAYRCARRRGSCCCRSHFAGLHCRAGCQL